LSGDCTSEWRLCGITKDNQQSLFKDVQDYFEGLSDPEERLENFIERNKGHGRIDERHVFVLRNVTFL
jgi:hypothetical protein